MADIKEMKCSSCGAPLPFVAGESVFTCAYCGSTTMLADAGSIVKVEEHFIIPSVQNKDGIKAAAKKWMGEGFFKAKDLPESSVVKETTGLYLPFWVVNVKATTQWSGQNRKTREVGTGDNKRTETYYVPASGNFSENLGWVVYARTSNDEYFGLDALNPGGKSATADWGGFALGMGMGSKTSQGVDLATGKKPFMPDLAKGLKIINGQIVRGQAEDRAKSQVIDYHRKKADGQVDELMNCDTNVYLERTELIYAPMWFLNYEYKGKPYRMLIEGHQGRVITGEAPVGKWDKVTVSAVVGGIVAVGCGAAGFYTHTPWLFIGTAVAVIAVGIHVIMTAMKKD